MVRRSALPNGLRIVTEPLDGVPSVTIGIWVESGSRFEPPHLGGISHFLEHLLFKGTPERTSRQIALAMDAVGGELNAYTTREYTVYETRLPAARVETGLGLLGEVVTEPAFRPEEVDAEREVILDEILLAADTPDDVVHIRLYEALFPDHAIGRETLGTPDSVADATRDEIAAFFDEWYRPANLVIAAAGDLEHDAVVGAIGRSFASVDAGRRPGRSRPAARTVPLVCERRPTEQAYLMAGWQSVDVHDADRYALWLANHVLGGGPASRLFDEIREQRSLAYVVGSATSAYSDAGSLTVFAGTMPDRLGELLTVMDDVIARLADEGPTEEEHAASLGYLEGSLLLSLEDSGSRMGRLGAGETVRGRIIPVDTQLERLRAVTPDAARDVLRRVTAADRSVSVVGPVDEDHPALARLGSH